MNPQKIAYYLRSTGNIHYFAALKPYLDYFVWQGIHQNCLIVDRFNAEDNQTQEYQGYTHLFTTNCDLDSYDLVLTPTFLRDEERTNHTRAVQIFHGMSDKPFTYERDFSNYLLCLCVGQRQVDRLLKHECNRNLNWALIGYPKFDQKSSEFGIRNSELGEKPLPSGVLDAEVSDPDRRTWRKEFGRGSNLLNNESNSELPTLPKLFNNDKKTIIYSPTWRKENISSIEIFLDRLDVVAEITQDYNLIVKPHPNIFNPDRQFYDQKIIDRLHSIPNIKLIHSGNVMPWFAQSDLCIGDISASGYEWLYYNKPIVFLNPQPGILQRSNNVSSLTYLWQCGDVCDDVGELKQLIDENLQRDLYQAKREYLLHYSVFNPRDNGATKRGVEEIEQLLDSSISHQLTSNCLSNSK